MNSREIALEILLDIEKNKGYSNIVINQYLKKYKVGENTGLIRELVYGVLENKYYLDYIIKNKSSIRLKKIHPTVLMILRMGVYQICFLNKIPESAAVNEAVNLTRAKKLGKSSGFVNGVLRSVVRDGDNALNIKGVDDRDYLSIRYSHPAWMVDSWINTYGYEFTKELCRSNNKRPELNIRTNTMVISRDELKEKLEELGFKSSYTQYSSYGLVVENPINIVGTDEYRNGLFSIQDESSMLVGEVMDISGQPIILDMCSAPGGKAGHIGELLNSRGRIIARDKYEQKVGLIDRNFKRLGIENADVQLYNGFDLDESLIGQVDYCLLDAPCSALGTIRRSPEIKYSRTEEEIASLIESQKKLLDIGSKYLKVGGSLVYSTCTINKDENINQIKDFLARNENYRLAPIKNKNLRDFKTSRDGYLEIYPNLYDMDGFFIAKMERVK